MKQPFKAGDRVAVYAGPMRIIGAIALIEPDGHIILDKYENVWHPKQCRRLIKKQRREVWIRQSSEGGLTSGWMFSLSGDKPIYIPTDEHNRPNGTWIRFREVTE